MAELSEDEICKLLDKIHERTGIDSALLFRYRFQQGLQALLGVEKPIITTIKDGYLMLRRSKDYYDKALSLVIVMVESYGSKKEIDVLNDHIALFHPSTDVIIRQLNLWIMLTSVAFELSKSKDAVRELVSKVGSMIKVNTEHILKETSLASALSAFKHLEKRGKLLEAMCTILNDNLGYSRLYKSHVKEFNPNKPITLTVLNVPKLGVPTDASHQEEDGIKIYESSLIDFYKNLLIIELNQWPPVKRHFYINLAAITSEFMPRADTFSRATIRGSVDDVYKKKELIKFEDVFPDELLASKEHYVSLIEGRPGCGKSTLVTKVSKDWAEGKILKNMELFLLVRLRRFVDRENLTLKDLFSIYCPDSSAVDKVLDKVIKEGGKGMCFAFDGLDEYSARLKEGNLIMKIIHGQVLPKATVFMTTRPATAERFRRRMLLSQNIEIIGFLKEEIRDYIKSYYQGEENGEAKTYELTKYIEEHPNIERMCYLPLHIAMIVHLYAIDQTLLPKTETDLYHKFTIHTLYRSLLKDPSPEMELEQDDIELHEFSHLPGGKSKIFKQVCKLAFLATVEQKQMFTGCEILERYAIDLPEVPVKREFDSVGLLTVDRMIAQSGLPTKTFSFLHLTHQEFLTAVHIVDHLSDSEELATVEKYAGAVHMWVVWKFLCGLHARKFNNPKAVFTQSFQSIIAANVSTHIASLNMVHCAFESQSQVSCSVLMRLLEGDVNMVDIALNPSDCLGLGYVLARAHEEVKKIDFSYCHLGPDGMEAFVQQLKEFDIKLTKVELLRLRARIDYKPLGSQGALNLIKLLEKLPNLGELRLYGNKLKSRKFERIAPAIENLTHIHTLVLSRNDLEIDTGPLVSNVLGHLPLLHTFYISYNPLTEKGLESMKPGLLKCSKLEILGLRSTSLGEGAGVHLSEILSTLTELELIELYQNKLGDKGVCDMVPGLSEAKSLKTLGLVENFITDRGAIELSKYVKAASTTRRSNDKEMQIYYNYGMTDKGKIALRTAEVETLNIRIAV